LTRVQKITNEYNPSLINITERSVLSDYNIFAKMLKDDGKLNEIEWKIYLNWMELLLSKFEVKPKLLIYLQLDPIIAYNRIKHRHREEESSIPLEYIQKVHEYHERWILSQTEIPVLIIDASKNFKDDKEVFDGYICAIKEKIKEIML
jgi:deoxyadenosine/deoxycytidine kinase